MEDNTIKLVFQTIAAGSGFAEVTQQTSELQKKLGKLSQGAQVLGQAFGSIGSSLGRGIGMLLQGGIWGAAAEGVRMLIDYSGVFKSNSEQTNGALSEQAKRLEEIRRVYNHTVEAIDKETERKKRQIELTKELTKAEHELAAAKAKAAGDDVKAAKIAESASKAEEKANEKIQQLTVQQASARLDAARKAASGSRYVKADGTFDAAGWEAERRRLSGEIATLQTKIGAESGGMQSIAGNVGYTKSGTLYEELEKSKEAMRIHVERSESEKMAAENLRSAIIALDDATKMQKANAIKAQAAETTARASTEAAKQAILTKSTSAQAGTAGSYAARFQAAFELWRDPSAAEADRAKRDERDRAMARFSAMAAKYPYQDRINEAAHLMYYGEDATLAERMREWRKQGNFSARDEQLVMGAAAQRNQTEAERSLVSIRDASQKICTNLEYIKTAIEGGQE